MAEVNLGRIGFVNKGSWNSSVDYKINDVVKYGGNTYAAKRPNTGVTPPTNGTDTDDWFYFVNNSDYVDKTSDEDILGIKNFTNGITTSEIDGDKTIDGETTFVISPEVPEPTDSNDAVNKAYVDDKTIINNFTDKPTPDDTDNLVLQEAGGDLKKLSFANLKLWILSLFNPTLTANATLTGIDNKIVMNGIVTSLGLEIGDVIQFTSVANANNQKMRTVESIINNNEIIVNYEHCGNRANGTLKLTDETLTNATVKRISKYYNATLGLGQALVDVKAFRVSEVSPSWGTLYSNNTNRPIQISFITLDAHDSHKGSAIQIDGDTFSSVVSGLVNFNSSKSSVLATIPIGSNYALMRQFGDTVYSVRELR